MHADGFVPAVWFFPNDDDEDMEPDIDFLERYLDEAGEVDEQRLLADFAKYYALWFKARNESFSQEYVDRVVESKLREIKRYIAGDDLEGQP